MDTDELKKLLVNESGPAIYSRSELERAFRNTAISTMRKLQKRLIIDLVVSLSLVILIVSLTYFAGFRYWTEITIWMSLFACGLVVFHFYHRNLVRFEPGMGESLLEMTKSVLQRINRLQLIFRLTVPVAVLLMFSWLAIRYDLVNYFHLVWVLPLALLLSELALRIMYRDIRKSCTSIIRHISQPGE